jgi:glycosyltransferase involved in cell wall biosynthesis
MVRPELSIVIPFLNEETVLPLLQKRLQELGTHPDWELVFVSDGSTDSSVRILTEWAAHELSVKVVELTRTFGHQAAVSAGLSVASGRYVGVMDADLQDEPEIILQMHEQAVADDYDVVYAVRARRSEGAVKRFCYHAFYRLFSFFADSPVQIDSGDFCVMNRRAVNLLLDLPERVRFVRGLRAWLGLRSKPFKVSRSPRAAGEPRYSLSGLIQLASQGITSFSVKPLRLGFVCGTLLCFIASLAAIGYVAVAVFTDIPMQAPGFTTLVVLLLFFNGLIFLYIGILGEYIGQIFMEVKGRPTFIIDKLHNFPEGRPGRLPLKDAPPR